MRASSQISFPLIPLPFQGFSLFNGKNPGFNGGNPGEGRTVPEEEGEDTEATNWFEVLLKVVVEFFRALFGKK